MNKFGFRQHPVAVGKYRKHIPIRGVVNYKGDGWSPVQVTEVSWCVAAKLNQVVAVTRPRAWPGEYRPGLNTVSVFLTEIELRRRQMASTIESMRILIEHKENITGSHPR